MVLSNRKGGVGNAVSSLGKLRSNMVITTVSPSSGSIHGGQTITIAGGGFTDNIEMTQVKIGDTNCTVLTASPSEITCTTAPCGES